MKRNKVLKEFRVGDFKAKRKDFAKMMIDRVDELSKFTDDNAWKDREFLKALNALYSLGVKHEQILDKLENSNLRVGRHSTTREYIRAFEDILSFRRKYPFRAGETPAKVLN